MTPNELADAAAIAVRKHFGNIDDPAKLEKLVRALNDIPESDWSKVPDELQTWVIDNVERINQKQSLRRFDGSRAEPEPEPVKAPAPVIPLPIELIPPKKEKPKPKPPMKSAFKKATPAPPAKTKKVKENPCGTNRQAPSTAVKMYILSNPAARTEDIQLAITQEGYTLSDSSVYDIANQFRHSILVLNDAGLLQSPKATAKKG